MFTGLIQSIGTIADVTSTEHRTALCVEHTLGDLDLGESIAIDGACLTVRTVSPGSFWVDTSEETLRCTTLGQLSRTSQVHLERSLRAGDRLGGHFVTGHVDGVGRIVGHKPVGECVEVAIEVPSELVRFISSKGCIAVDGTSLTVNRVVDARFDVMLIPFTLSATRLGEKEPGSTVNLEVDILARYVQRHLDLDPK